MLSTQAAEQVTSLGLPEVEPLVWKTNNGSSFDSGVGKRGRGSFVDESRSAMEAAKRRGTGGFEAISLNDLSTMIAFA